MNALASLRSAWRALTTNLLRSVLTMLGIIIGVALGALATWGVARFAGWQVALSVQAVLLAVGFSAAVGVFFGFYPARRAASLLPIQALRYE